MRDTSRSLVAGAMLSLLIAACGGGGDGPELSDARVGEPTGPNAAMYFTASSQEPDRLVGASTEVASSIQIHESVLNDDGTMGMNRLDALDVGPGSPLVLQPGGLHLMLIDVERLDVGSTIDVELNWEEAGAMTVEVEVVDPATTADG